MSEYTWTPEQAAAMAATLPEYCTAGGQPTLSPAEFHQLVTRFPSAFARFSGPAPAPGATPEESAARARYPKMFKQK